MKGMNYVATYKNKDTVTGKITKVTGMITVSNNGTIYKFGTSTVIHKDQIQYVKVIQHFEPNELPYDLFEKMFLK